MFNLKYFIPLIVEVPGTLSPLINELRWSITGGIYAIPFLCILKSLLFTLKALCLQAGSEVFDVCVCVTVSNEDVRRVEDNSGLSLFG